MSMVLHLAVALVAQSGIVVFDGLAVGMSDQGRWRSMDSLFSKSWPKPSVAPATVARLTEAGGFVLGQRGDVKPFKGSLKFQGEDGAPGDRGWTLADRTGTDGVVWFGPKPAAPKVTFAKTDSATYVAAVKTFLQGKGFKNPKPHIQTIALVDLDANGTQEALIFASSLPEDQIHNAFAGNMSNPRPNDYSVWLIRHVVGKNVKTITAYFSDGKKNGLEGHTRFAGLWDLDGKPGVEILTEWNGYEGWSGSVHAFSKGRLTLLAEAGDGV